MSEIRLHLFIQFSSVTPRLTISQKLFPIVNLQLNFFIRITIPSPVIRFIGSSFFTLLTRLSRLSPDGVPHFIFVRHFLYPFYLFLLFLRISSSHFELECCHSYFYREHAKLLSMIPSIYHNLYLPFV